MLRGSQYLPVQAEKSKHHPEADRYVFGKMSALLHLHNPIDSEQNSIFWPYVGGPRHEEFQHFNSHQLKSRKTKTKTKDVLVIEFTELFGIQRGTHYNYLQRILWISIAFPFELAILICIPFFLNCLKIGHQQICAQGPFMGFIHNYNAIFAEKRVRHELAHNHPISEIFYSCSVWWFFVESNGVSNNVADRPILFCSHPMSKRSCSHFTRLGDCYRPVSSQTTFENILRYLYMWSINCRWTRTIYWNSRVVLPDPVSPRRTVTSFILSLSIRASLPVITHTSKMC